MNGKSQYKVINMTTGYTYYSDNYEDANRVLIRQRFSSVILEHRKGKGYVVIDDNDSY